MRSVLNFPKVRAFYFHVYDCSLNTLVYLKKLVNLIEELEEVWVSCCVILIACFI